MSIADNEFNSAIEKAKMLAKSQQYEQELHIYQDLWQQLSNERRMQICASVITCLYKLKRYKQIITLYREYILDQDMSSYTKNYIAWAFYHHIILQTSAQNAQDLVEALESIGLLTDQKNEINALVFSVMHIMKNCRDDLNPKLVLQILDLLEPEHLSKTPNKSQSQDIEFPSAYENYLVYRSKALIESGNYHEAAEFCTLALESDIPFHNHQDIWLRRRLAFSYRYMKLYDQSIREMLLVASKKRDWFIDFELAELYHAKQDYRTALNYAQKAATKHGKLEMKKKLWPLMVDLFTKLDMPELALLCLKISLSICYHNKWKIAPDLSKLANTFSLDPAALPKPKILADEILAQFNKGKPAVQNPSNSTHSRVENEPIRQNCSGSFLRLLPHNRAGFIKTSSGNCYFRIKNLRFPVDSLQSGMPLVFDLRESFDPVKNQKSTEAINIRRG